MADEEAAEGSRRRTLMMPNSSSAAPEAPRTGKPEQSLAPAVTGEPEKDGSCGCSSGFECNICLEVAKEPVVTHCGHLFCWPCLYPWLHAQSPFCECPVCKGDVQRTDITPIYGRGSEEGDSTANLNLPPRPRGNRRESIMEQLHTTRDATEIESVLSQLLLYPGIMRSVPTQAGTEMTTVPAARQSADAAQVVLAAPPQQSMEQLSTSSTAAVILGEPGSSRRSRSSGSPTIRRTRRPPQ